MAQWVRKLDISIEWKQCKNHEITVQQLAKVLIDKLSVFDPNKLNEDIQFLIDDFNIIATSSNDDGSEIENFDDAMKNLYSWADASLDGEWNGKKNCWVELIG